jgi:hypothetical protein
MRRRSTKRIVIPLDLSHVLDYSRTRKSSLSGGTIMTENQGFDGPLPLPWQRLAAELRTQIENGDLKPGAPVPSITELIRAGRASARETCARALWSLEAGGLIVRDPGRGYHAAGSPQAA